MKARIAVFAALLVMTFGAGYPMLANAQQQEGGIVTAKVELTATVENVDKTNRILTLRGPEGNMYDVKAGDQVKNFDQINKGDKVSVEYLRSVALSLGKEAAAPAEFSQFVEVAPPGEKPQAVKAATAQVSATIENVDKEKREVTLKGPRGKTMVLKAGPEANLDVLKKGDEIHATITEAVAVSVKKAS